MECNMGVLSPTDQGETCSIRGVQEWDNFPNMQKPFKEALEFALKATGRSLRSVTMATGVSYDQFKSLMQGKSQRPNVDDALKLAAGFGVSIEDFFSGNFSGHSPRIAVAGFVGAGDSVELVDAFSKGDGHYFIPCPPQISPHGVVAVEVKGDSMSPIYADGDVLLYSRSTHEGVPSEAIGRQVIAQTEDERVWVKQLKVGRETGLFHLLSLNPSGVNLLDQRVVWAAPVRLHLPKEFVKRVE